MWNNRGISQSCCHQFAMVLHSQYCFRRSSFTSALSTETEACSQSLERTRSLVLVVTLELTLEILGHAPPLNERGNSPTVPSAAKPQPWTSLRRGHPPRLTPSCHTSHTRLRLF